KPKLGTASKLHGDVSGSQTLGVCRAHHSVQGEVPSRLRVSCSPSSRAPCRGYGTPSVSIVHSNVGPSHRYPLSASVAGGGGSASPNVTVAVWSCSMSRRSVFAMLLPTPLINVPRQLVPASVEKSFIVRRQVS